MVKGEKVKSLFYIAMGFVIGCIVCLYLILRESVGKLTINKLKKVWEMLND
jgi:hypothetical protein